MVDGVNRLAVLTEKCAESSGREMLKSWIYVRMQVDVKCHVMFNLPDMGRKIVEEIAR